MNPTIYTSTILTFTLSYTPVLTPSKDRLKDKYGEAVANEAKKNEAPEEKVLKSLSEQPPPALVL